MKRIAFLILLSFALSLNAQENAPTLERIVPSNVLLFIRFKEVKRSVQSAKILFEDILPQGLRGKAMNTINELKAKTGIDLLNINSISSMGINIDESLGIAHYGMEGQSEKVVVYVPCLANRDLPMTFVEMLKKNMGKKDVDRYPSITEYRGSRVYQVGKDIFMTEISGYFVIASRGELIHSVIDTSVNGQGSLATDPLYTDYVAHSVQSYDLDAFARREFIAEMFKTSSPKGSVRSSSGGNDNRKYVNGSTADPTFAKNATGIMPAGDQQESYTINWIDYGSFVFSVAKEKLTVGISFKCNESDQETWNFIQTLKPTQGKEAIAYKHSGNYMLLSLWPDKIQKAIGGQDKIGQFYSQIKMKLQNDWGIIVERDLIPHFTGVIQSVIEKRSMIQANTAYMLTMKSQKDGEMLLGTIKNYQKKKQPSNEFGEITIGRSKAFWIMDKKMDKTYFAADSRGFYVGDSGELVTELLRAKTIGEGGTASIKSAFDGNVFWYAFLGKESFMRPLAMMLAIGYARSDDVRSFLNRMGDIYVTGRKNSALISLEAEIEMEQGGR